MIMITNITLMLMLILCHAVPKLQLREQCFAQDICADIYARCIQGVCACVAGNPHANNTCREYTLYSLLLYIPPVYYKNRQVLCNSGPSDHYCKHNCLRCQQIQIQMFQTAPAPVKGVGGGSPQPKGLPVIINVLQ